MSRDRQQQVSKQDRVVAVMGPTGAGKSTFIEHATRQNGGSVGHDLKSCTSDIRAVRVNHPRDGRPVVVIDTPGFNDTYKSDMEILTMIADWLVQTYKNKNNLTTIIYMHSITECRMTGSALKNLRMFGTVLGQKAMPNVTMVTTKWSEVKIEQGERREQQLQTEFWKDMIADGCRTARFEGTYDSAWSIIGSLSDKHRAKVQLPREIVDSKLRLNETRAGIALKKELEELIKSQEDTDRRLQQLMRNQDNEVVVQELNQQRAETEVKIKQTADQLCELKIPLTRRVRLFFRSRS